MATELQCGIFINKIASIAQKKCSGKIPPSVCIAQACCESAYGTSPKMKNANAVFGIKVGKGKAKFGNAWKGKAYSTKTKECYDGTTYTEITDMFRAYDSLEESVQDYIDMLTVLVRYSDAIGETDPEKCITAIKKGGYATSPTYVSTIMSIIKKFNLTQYDKEPRKTVKIGSTGNDVKELQELLQNKGYYIGESGSDGAFGINTQRAVVAFQFENGLDVDGKVGKKTWAKLED